MELLTVLTLVYAGILVLALAASLVAIWFHLSRTAGALGAACRALARVRERTTALEGHFRRLQEGVEGAAGELEAAVRSPEEPEERPGAAGGRAGKLEPVR